MILPTQPPPLPSTGDTWLEILADLGPEYPARLLLRVWEAVREGRAA